MTFLYWISLIIGTCGALSIFLFRKAGIYNPEAMYFFSDGLSTDGGTILPVAPTSAAQNLYNAAKFLLGKHLTLNKDVPAEVGCAEAVSFVLRAAGYILPPTGIPNVNGVIEWMLSHGFIEQQMPAPGYVISAHNPVISIVTGAHIGICLVYGIGSNNSATGIFNENYSPINAWVNYFSTLGSVTRYFSPPDVIR